MSLRIASASFRGRRNFGLLLNELGLDGQAVEIGCHRGEFARQLLDSWKGDGRLTCVDPWSVPPGYESQARYLESCDREEDYQEAQRLLLGDHCDRVTLYRGLSREYADLCEDGSQDFVYLDGDHEPPACNEDIFVWWSRIRRGGVLAGHDVVMPGAAREDDWSIYIQPALFQFAAHRGLTVHLVPEDDPMSPWSYFIVKP